VTIEFKNPPKSKGNSGPRAETKIIIDTLQSRPGEWALIKRDVSRAAGSLWKKRPGIEAKASSIGKSEGKFDLYARWVGVQP
jgi:hypothetical protein